MNYMRYLLAIGMLAFAVQARADWLGSDITDIINNVKTILAEVTGDVKNTAADLQRQLNSLTQKGDTVKETVEDVLDLVVHRRTPFLDFIYGNPRVTDTRCGQGNSGQNTPCMNFRLDLENLVLDIADLRDRFPHIDKHGLGDGTILVDVIDHLPPFVLFGVYELLNKVPDWQDLPQNLAQLYDEIGDADAFSAEPLQAGAATVAQVAAKRGGPLPGPASGEASFGSPGTRLDLFCSQGKQPKWDQVRLNRFMTGLTWFANMLDGLSEALDASYVVEAIGEGASVPVFIKAFLKTLGKVVESILASVDAHRTNLGLCKQIETDVAACTQLVEYRTKAGTLKAYWVVKGVQQANGAFSSTVAKPLAQAGSLFAELRYRDAYSAICQAYGAIL